MVGMLLSISLDDDFSGRSPARYAYSQIDLFEESNPHKPAHPADGYETDFLVCNDHSIPNKNHPSSHNAGNSAHRYSNILLVFPFHSAPLYLFEYNYISK